MKNCKSLLRMTQKDKKADCAVEQSYLRIQFCQEFKVLFVRCKEFYEDEIDEEGRKLTRLNTSITKLSAEDIDSEILEPLQLMVKDAQKNVNELKVLVKN